jgi:hypothetical protein
MVGPLMPRRMPIHTIVVIAPRLADPPPAPAGNCIVGRLQERERVHINPNHEPI